MITRIPLAILIVQISLALCPVLHAGETDEGKWRRVSSVVTTWSTTTSITVAGNAVFVPVVLGNGTNQVEALFLLDTGASRTVVIKEIADRLNLNLNQVRKTRVQVVGGGLLDAYRATLSDITVGPYSMRNTEILIIEHRGRPVKFDGLLGMDLLRSMKYNVDLEQQVINWE